MIIYTCVKCKKLVQSLKGLCPVCGHPSPKEELCEAKGLPTSTPFFSGDCLENSKSHRHPDWIEQWEQVERRYYTP